MSKPSHKSQAKEALRPLVALGSPRHGHGRDGLIHGLGTYRTFKEGITLLSRWLRREYDFELDDLDESLALNYLAERSCVVGQKALDRDRQAIQLLLPRRLTRLRAADPHDELAKRSRACTVEELQLIKRFLSEDAAFACDLSWEGGLRAGEIPAIRHPYERPASSRRWDGDRFAGIAPERRRIFTVRGKGGLIREVCFSPETSERLEARRLPREIHVRDRTIDSRSAYRICGGQALSQAWSTASKRAVGFSNGFHSLRHSFTQRRVRELIALGFAFGRALEIVSQELGHFRPSITRAYLR